MAIVAAAAANDSNIKRSLTHNAVTGQIYYGKQLLHTCQPNGRNMV